MGTFILHPDRYIFRDKPLTEAAEAAAEELYDASDTMLALSYSRGDRADDPATRMGYNLRYFACLFAELAGERRDQQAQKKKKPAPKVRAARKPATKKRKANHG